MMRNGEAPERVTEAQNFVALALEASVYRAKGPDHGLTVDELSDLAVRVGRNKLLVQAAANEMYRAALLTRTPDRRFRLLPGDWRFTKFEHGWLRPEHRPIDALDAVVKILRNKPASTRMKIIEEGVRPLWGGVDWRISLALEILYLARVVHEMDGIVHLAPEYLDGPLPSEILTSAPAQPQDTTVNELFGVVGDLLHERLSKAVKESGALGSEPGLASLGNVQGAKQMTLESRCILFMDLAGWSQLSAPQITAYLEKALPRLATKIREFKATHVNTWGDAVVGTFLSAVEAANCALDVRDFFRRSTESDGVPRGLTPRISLHTGEVIIAHNPLLGREDIFGEHVHIAARLEPVTAKGQVYCTDAFANSLLALKGSAPVTHAMGEVDLPKGLGRMAIYAVTGPNEDAPLSPEPRPRSGQPGPSAYVLPLDAKDVTIETLDRRMKAMEGHLDDLKAKVGTSPPDEIRARIDQLQAELVSSSVNARRLTAGQQAEIVQALKGLRGTIDIVHDPSSHDAFKLAEDFAATFRKAGWTAARGQQPNVRVPPPSGIAVELPSAGMHMPDPEIDIARLSETLKGAMSAANVRADIRERSEMWSNAHACIIVTHPPD